MEVGETSTHLGERGRTEPPAGGRIVEHYRVDVSRRMLRAIGIGVFVMTVGLAAATLAIMLPRWSGDIPEAAQREPLLPDRSVTRIRAQLPEDVRSQEAIFGLIGLAFIPTGGLISIIGLNRLLSEDHYLALRTDGAVFSGDGGERDFVAWADVEEIRAERGAVGFIRHDGDVWLRTERYAGIDAEELAKRASEVRRKGLFGLL